MKFKKSPRIFLITSIIFSQGYPLPPPLAPLSAWLRRPIRPRCQCFAPWDAVSTVTPAPTACARSVTRKTCKDNREGADPALQVREVGRWEMHDLTQKWGRGSLCTGMLGVAERNQNLGTHELTKDHKH